MVKTRVHDLAAEFGVGPEQLLGMLKDMNIFVRSHMSALETDQVSAIRVRWEREKRKHAEEPAAKKGRRKAVKAEPAPAPVEVRPSKRRRTAAEVAEVEAQHAIEKEAELAALELERPLLVEVAEPTTSQSLEERARALFKDLPPAPVEIEEEAPTPEEAPVPEPRTARELFRGLPPSQAPTAAQGAAASVGTASAPTEPVRAPFIPPRIQRPPAASPRGPRPVFSSSAPASPTRPPSGPSRPGAPAAGGPPARNFGPDAEKAGSRKKGKKGRRSSVDQDAVQANILKTLQGMKGPAGRKGRRSDEPSFRDLQAGRAAEEREKEKTRIRVNEFVSVSELAGAMKVPATQIVQFAFKELGLMVTVNQRLDFDQIELIASAFGFEAVREQEYAADISTVETDETEEQQQPRPPVVTIMGHVDHGKTSLLDYIRKANVVAGEAGGITQHIGAYHVSLPDDRAITFLDTPGHQAFTAMRARGAQVTDTVVLVVAADDQVMPQTVEAISHARNAGVPMIVAINKIDLPSADVAKVKRDLLQHSVVLEEFGGNVLSAEISAKKGTGVDRLLEQILLQAEILDLTANPDGRAQGAVLEATLDPGKGPLATILVQKGTLKPGDNFICGKFSGRVRALYDERGKG
ncbi:MAG: translation initiation factor IF-2 N-terminal domain-containing protein, partial [Gemmatimonadales bacterium]|nr:translation initiation factor IF-2 N-terminal domain-containing protein [Gemmatimonadales bacterium]